MLDGSGQNRLMERVEVSEEIDTLNGNMLKPQRGLDDIKCKNWGALLLIDFLKGNL